MKKSFLCILLVFVLLLGGCVLTDFPVKTEGMVESAEMILGISDLLIDIVEIRDHLSSVHTDAEEEADVKIETAYQSFQTKWKDLTQTALPKSVPFLRSPVPEEPFVTQLLDDCKKAADLSFEAYQKLQKNDPSYASIHEETSSMMTSIYQHRTELTEGWIASVASMREFADNNPKLQKVLIYHSLFAYVYNTLAMQHNLYRCTPALSRYVNDPEEYDTQFINDLTERIFEIGSDLKGQYESADQDLKPLLEPFYTDIVTPVIDFATLIQFEMEQMAKDKQTATKMLNVYLSQFDGIFVEMTQTYKEHKKAFFDDFYEIVN